ncbi:MAG: hypothetical protein GY853_14390 [PVC group bacterium]|nr:hypothetical protein [PVC group bacterium]
MSSTATNHLYSFINMIEIKLNEELADETDIPGVVKNTVGSMCDRMREVIKQPGLIPDLLVKIPELIESDDECPLSKIMDLMYDNPHIKRAIEGVKL